jgi:hypothetical protein
MFKKGLGVAIVLVLGIYLCLVAIDPGKIYSARYIGTVISRPESSIGPNLSSPVWRKLELVLSRNSLKTPSVMDSTFHLQVSDCYGQDIAVEDVYVDSMPLNRLKFSRDERSILSKSHLGKRVISYVYLRDQDFQSSPTICVQAKGGSMIGYGFKGRMVKVQD